MACLVVEDNLFDKYNIPVALVEYVLKFFWDDPKTFGRWLQTCHKNRTLCLDKMTAMKVWWEQVQTLSLTAGVRKTVFHAAFSKKLNLEYNQMVRKPANI